MNIDLTKYQVTCLIIEDKRNLEWKNDILILRWLDKKKKKIGKANKNVFINI